MGTDDDALSQQLLVHYRSITHPERQRKLHPGDVLQPQSAQRIDDIRHTGPIQFIAGLQEILVIQRRHGRYQGQVIHIVKAAVRD